jgi:hypothetical protein
MLKKPLIVLIVILLAVTGTHYGQSLELSVLNVTGFTHTDGEFTLTSNIGESLIRTVENDSRVLTQGFLQPIVSGPCQNTSIRFYPNPTQDEVFISSVECDLPIDKVAVIDLHGRIVSEQQVQDGRVSLLDFNPGVYLIQSYFEDEQVAGTFKIAKISN